MGAKKAKKVDKASDDALQKVDPDDYQAYTLKQLCKKYKGQFSTKEVQEYWESSCLPLDKASPNTLPSVQNEEFHYASPPWFACKAGSESEREHPLQAKDGSGDIWF